MSVYFEYFPDIKYKTNIVKNITKRVDFVADIELNEEDIRFLPVSLQDNERPEDISYYYYGTVEYTNFILLLNKCYDPYKDWLMDEKKLHNFIFEKYKDISKKDTLAEVVAWTMDNTILDNVLYFIKDDKKYSVDSVIIDVVPQEEWYKKDNINLQEDLFINFINPSEYKPYRYFDFEYDSNENRRIIYVVNKNYISEVIKQYRDMIIK